MQRIAIFVMIFLAALFLSGCKDDGEGSATGVFSVSACGMDNEEFDLSIDYFAATYFENSLAVRLQHTTQNLTFANGLLLEIRDVDQVADHLSAPIEITLVPSVSEFKETGPTTESGFESGYPATPYNSPARAALYLYDSCPDNPPGFGDGEGTITFTHIYEPGKSDRIKGTFSLTFLDPRTWRSPGDSGDHATVSGDFDFEYSNVRTAGEGF